MSGVPLASLRSEVTELFCAMACWEEYSRALAEMPRKNCLRVFGGKGEIGSGFMTCALRSLG